MNNIFVILSLLIISVTGCKKVDLGYGGDINSVNLWAEDVLRKDYLWYNDIPESSKLNYSSNTESFFTSMLSDKDGYNSTNKHHYFSYIQKVSATAKGYMGDDYYYGFEFQAYANLDGSYFGLILYVLPDTPAAESGLRRGDVIYKIDGSTLNAGNYKKMYSGNACVFTVSRGNNYMNINIPAARYIEDNPVYISKVINYNGIRVGYMMYNHFTGGDNINSEKYNNSMREAFSYYKTNGIDELVIDLRYNPGGFLSCSQLMTTMIAPTSAMGDIFCKLIYNDKRKSSETTYYLDKSLINSGANLNMGKVYFIVSNRTASASEAVINGLKPYINDITIVGGTTVGKNVGSQSYFSPNRDWVMYPILFKIYNKNNQSDYSSGFKPDYFVSESSSIYDNLGDENELMLNYALSVISGIKNTSAVKSSVSETEPVYSSLDRKIDLTIIE